MLNKVLKLIKRLFLGAFILFLVLPFFIPRDGREKLPTQPFDNSLFVNTAQGISIHTRIHQPSGESRGQIMLVHGLGGSTISFEDNAPFLASQGYFVVSVDLPAFGFSSRQTGLIHTQDNRAMWLWDVLSKIEVLYNLKPTWILGGHSMGSSVVLAMNNAQPNKTEGLVLIAPAIASRTQRNPFLSWAILNTPAGEWLRVFATYGLFPPERFEASLASAFGVPPTPMQLEGYLRPLRLAGTTQALREFFATSETVSVNQWLHPETKTIVLWGEEDAWIPVTQLNALEAVALNLQVFILSEEGHNPMETAPEQFNQLFLQGLEAWRTR